MIRHSAASALILSATALSAAPVWAQSTTSAAPVATADAPPEAAIIVPAIGACWNTGALSPDALGVTVILGVSIGRDGVPVTDSIRLLSSSGGSGEAVDQAFGAARRAVVRCGAAGFALPAETWNRWRELELVFPATGRGAG